MLAVYHDRKESEFFSCLLLVGILFIIIIVVLCAEITANLQGNGVYYLVSVHHCHHRQYCVDDY